MTLGLTNSVGRISQLRSGAGAGGALVNQILTGLIRDEDTVFAPSIETSIQQVAIPLVSDDDTVLSPSLSYAIDAPTIGDQDTVLSSVLSMNIVGPLISDGDTVNNPSVAPGAVSVSFSPILDADTVNGPTVAPGASPIATPVIVDTDNVLSSVVADPGNQPLTIPLISDADTVNNPAVAAGAASVTVPLVSDTDSVNNPAVAAGAASVTVPLISDTDTVNSPTVAEAAAGGIVVGTVSNAQDNTSNSASVSHTPSSGTTRLVIIGQFHGASGSGAAATYACTVGGTGADQRAVGQALSDRDFPNLVMFSFDNPTTGSPLTCTVTQTSSNAGLRNAIHVIDLQGAATGGSSIGDTVELTNGSRSAFDFAMDADEADSIFVACISQQGGTNGQPLNWDVDATERSELVAPTDTSSGNFAALSGVATQPSAGTGTTDNNVGGDFDQSEGGQGCCVEFLAA